mmetsp:Transcript_14095/g.46308  ORF Transcript_14095/g.46308 Transcript_14095/m.46308 type:complete len:255 (+) Transcript_14095:1033-1797(+)
MQSREESVRLEGARGGFGEEVGSLRVALVHGVLEGGPAPAAAHRRRAEICPALEQGLHRLCVARESRDVERRVTRTSHRVDTSPGDEQSFDGVRVPEPRGDVERRLAILVLAVCRLRRGEQQERESGAVAAAHSLHHGRGAVVGGGARELERGARGARQERRRARGAPPLRAHVQRRLATLVALELIHAESHQRAHRGDVAVIARLDERHRRARVRPRTNELRPREVLAELSLELAPAARARGFVSIQLALHCL